jgi:hypothetical protein
MNVLAQSWLAMTVGIMAMTVVTVPTWLFASMNRGTLWRIRDCIFDARRTCTLPDSDAVDLLLDRAERFIQVVPNITAAQIWYVKRRVPASVAEDPRSGRLSSQLPADTGTYAVRLFEVLEHELERAIMRQQLLCSWSGLLFVAPRHIDAVRWVLRRRPFQLEGACTRSAEGGTAEAAGSDADTVHDDDAPLARDVVAIAEGIVAEVYRSIAPSSRPDLTKTPA